VTPSRVPLLVVAVLSGTAYGDPLAVRTAGELAFSQDELEAALGLRARLATPEAAARLEASVIAEGANVRIELRGRTRRVGLDGAQGDAAARLVAFAILDLAGADLDPPDPPLAPPEPEVHETVVPPRRSAAPAWSIGVWATGGSRQEVALELGIRVRGRMRAFGSAGASLLRTDEVSDVELARRDVPARVGVAWRMGAIELRASALALIEHAAVERASTELLLGGGAAVAWTQKVGAATLLAGGGADVFATTIAYRASGMPLVTTERVGWWAGLGIAFEGSR
jgi:hypothetical protein